MPAMMGDHWTTAVAIAALVGLACIMLLATWLLVTVVSGVRTHLWDYIQPATMDLVASFGEWAVVTGATDGIGKAYAQELARRGLNVVLISRSQDRLNAVAKEIEQRFDVKTRTILADFCQGQSVYNHIETQLKNIPVGILVNNVGQQYSYPMRVGEVDPQQMWDMIMVNVGAVTMMTRLVLAGMQQRHKGAVVNVSSGSELQPIPLMAVYAATKVFIKSFSAALRCEYQPDNITVQHVTPFFVNTKMNAFSQRLRVTSLLVPDAPTFAQHAVNTLGRVHTTTGYWAHDVQRFLVVLLPVWLRTQVSGCLCQVFRRDYLSSLHKHADPNHASILQ